VDPNAGWWRLVSLPHTHANVAIVLSQRVTVVQVSLLISAAWQNVYAGPVPVGADVVAVHDAIVSSRQPVTAVRQSFTVEERSGRGRTATSTAGGDDPAIPTA
jgi:hypothetical protein